MYGEMCGEQRCTWELRSKVMIFCLFFAFKDHRATKGIVQLPLREKDKGRSSCYCYKSSEIRSDLLYIPNLSRSVLA